MKTIYNVISKLQELYPLSYILHTLFWIFMIKVLSVSFYLDISFRSIWITVSLLAFFLPIVGVIYEKIGNTKLWDLIIKPFEITLKVGGVLFYILVYFAIIMIVIEVFRMLWNWINA
jgi:hypothetical protein